MEKTFPPKTSISGLQLV